MLLAGTCYDLYLQNEKKKKKMTLNCTTYDLTNPKHVKLDINIPGTKITNGNYFTEYRIQFLIKAIYSQLPRLLNIS